MKVRVLLHVISNKVRNKTVTTTINIVLNILSNAIRQGLKDTGTRMEEVKLFLSANDIIPRLKNPKENKVKTTINKVI